MTPRSPNKYTMLLEAATELFLEQGFQEVTIKKIMDRAGGCSRETVYRYFKNKEEIFEAVIDNQIKSYLDIMSSLDMESDDMRQGLLIWTTSLITTVTSERFIKLRRLVISEMTTRPEHGKLYYQHTYAPGIKAVAKFFKIQQHKGNLKHIDADNLAKYFIGMLLNDIVHKRLLGIRKAPNNKQIQQFSNTIVDDFVNTFGTGN